MNVKTTKGIEQRVKIIRDSIGKFSWDTSESGVNEGWGINEWSESDIMKLLNPGYETNPYIDSSGTSQESYANNSLYWNGTSGTCYNDENNSTTGCEFSSTIGLSKSVDYISDDIIWNTGTNGETEHVVDRMSTNETGLPRHFYKYERSTDNGKICKTSYPSCNDEVLRTVNWKSENGKKALVGLMYPSDYGYAVGGGESYRNRCLNTEMRKYCDDIDDACYQNDWLGNGNDSQWTVSPYAKSGYGYYVFYVDYTGLLLSASAVNSKAVRPVVYLKPSVTISGGGGSIGNNFQLQIEQ